LIQDKISKNADGTIMGLRIRISGFQGQNHRFSKTGQLKKASTISAFAESNDLIN
jgi:hypothetical protein